MFFAGDLSFPKRFDHDTAAYFCAGERGCLCSEKGRLSGRQKQMPGGWVYPEGMDKKLAAADGKGA